MKTMKIFGPPGTGKTTTLISTLGKLLERGYHPSQIAFLSHTKAAAEEARDRIAQEFTSFDLSKDFVWFRTIHSASCRKLGIGRNEIFGNADIKRFAQEKGWPCKGIADMETLMDQVDQGVNYDVVLNARSLASHKRIGLDEAVQLLPDNPAYASAGRFLEDYETFKKEIGKVDFVDMLEMAIGKGTLGVKVMLVDECQDLSELQLAIIREWSADLDYLYLAGDDDQAIYAFMGSSEYGFLDYKCDHEVVLHTSYRCPQEIGTPAEKIIAKVKRRREKDVLWNEEKPGKVKRIGDWQALDWRALAEGDKSVMVLVRHRRLGSSIGYNLMDMNIPHSLMGQGVTTGKRADLIKLYLDMRGGAAHSAVRVADMMKHVGDTGNAAKARRIAADERGATITREDIPDFNWDTNHWPKMFARWDRERKSLENLRRLINIYGLDILGKPLNIDISTYHASKGREADIVVLITDCYKITWEEQLTNPDVETRICYVGLTRAKQEVIIVSPQTDMYMKGLIE